MARKKRGARPTKKTQGFLRRVAGLGLTMVVIKGALGAAGSFAAKKAFERFG